MRLEIVIIALLSLVWMASTQGCSSKESAAPSDASQTTDAPHPASPAEDKHDHGDHMSSDVQANLAKISKSDRTAVEKQQHCPVSGEQLGAMGAPIKVDVEGRQVWLCCESCKDSLLTDPDKYLSKLP